MEKNNSSSFRKIELKELIKKLVELYNSGADYIDIAGSNSKRQDVISIIVRDEYMSKDIEEEEEDFEEEIKTTSFSEDDLKDII